MKHRLNHRTSSDEVGAQKRNYHGHKQPSVRLELETAQGDPKKRERKRRLPRPNLAENNLNTKQLMGNENDRGGIMFSMHRKQLEKMRREEGGGGGKKENTE